MNPEPSQDDVQELVRAAALAWHEFSARRDGAFHHFLPGDYALVFERLRELRSRADTFLELGSGVGAVTILADLLGYDAYGIEIEPDLVERSRDMAERFGSRAQFVEGSFVPPDYRDEVDLMDADFPAVTEGENAYAELEQELGEFDLVYAYPWPGEEDWLFELVRRHAGPRTIFLAYRGEEGTEVHEGFGVLDY